MKSIVLSEHGWFESELKEYKYALKDKIMYKIILDSTIKENRTLAYGDGLTYLIFYNDRMPSTFMEAQSVDTTRYVLLKNKEDINSVKKVKRDFKKAEQARKLKAKEQHDKKIEEMHVYVNKSRTKSLGPNYDEIHELKLKLEWFESEVWALKKAIKTLSGAKQQ